MEPTITDVARNMPACCMTCTTSTGPFADTGVNIGGEGDFVGYGWLYLCEKCVGLLGNAFGQATADEARGLKATIADLEEEVAEVRDSLDEARLNRVVPIGQVLEHLKAHPPLPALRPVEPPDAA